MMGPVLSLYLSLEQASGVDLSFVVPDVASVLADKIDNIDKFMPSPMRYNRWVKVLRLIATHLGLPAELAGELWTTYTFRRMLPTIADIIGMHEGYRQQLG